jgi:IS5 family transposase
MLGKQGDNTDLFQCVTMEALVPENHRLRRLKAVLDLSFVRERVAPLYSSVGRASVDPEVVVRMWVLQHLHGFSEREVCDEVLMHAGFRWFCGLSFNDPVPDQSTLVKLRTEKWAGSGLWEALLRETVRACEAVGIASTERMGVDGTQIRANAATVSLEDIPPPLSVTEGAPNIAPLLTPEPQAVQPEQNLVAQAIRPVGEEAAPLRLTMEEGGRLLGKHKSGDPDWHGERFSNATHRSTTDPDARLYRKGSGQEAQLRYLGHYLADVKSGVIYGAMVTRATGTAEREATLALLDTLPVLPKELVADLGYRDGAFLADVLKHGVTPLVPIGDQKLEEEPTWKRCTKNPKVQKKREERLRAARARNATRLASQGRRGAHAQRERTRLEHLFGEAKEHHGLARAQGRGLVRVEQQIRLTAAVQNLKRLMSSRRPPRATEQTATLRATRLTAQLSVLCSPTTHHKAHSSRIRRHRCNLNRYAARTRTARTTLIIIAVWRRTRYSSSRF